MRKRFDFVADSSHGWLKVPMVELERLGIVDQISTYSYLKNGMAYLEEDRDMAVFLQARDARGESDIRMIQHHSNKQSRIRSYPSFVVEPALQVISELTTDEVVEPESLASPADTELTV